jgi:acetyl-CoA C-acetyltransferase
MVEVGERWEESLMSLAVNASMKAIDNAKMGPPQAVFFSNMMSGRLQVQDHLGTFLADLLGQVGISSIRVEAACASGGAGFHAGYSAVAAGLYDTVLVCGAEKMSDCSTEEVTTALMTAEDREYTGFTGVTFVGLNALVHRLYTQRYGVTEEQMAALSVLCHENGVNNPYAQFRKKLKVEDVLESPFVADPIRLLMAAPMSDGAAAIVLTTEENAKKAHVPYARVLSSRVGTDAFRLYERDDLTTFHSVRRAAEAAAKDTGKTPSDLDVLEVHDAFTIVGYAALEGLGLSGAGKSPAMVERGDFGLSGRPAVNTMGGLKSRGHPIGGTGIYQIAEVFLQLTGQAGKNQVDGAKLGAAINIGGVGTTSTLTLLEGGVK